MYDTAVISTKCSKCDNEIVGEKCWTPGGMNDYGGWIVKCSTCNHVFHFRLGRDITDSRLISGAEILDTYDDEQPEEREVIFNRHGLTFSLGS